MSVSLETYLVKLYLDRAARRAFPAGPHATATGEREAPRARRPWARLLARWRARRQRRTEARDGSAGAVRTLGGMGAMSGPPSQ